MKQSKNKVEVFNVLKKSKYPMNVQEIYEEILKIKQVNLCTIYRCINQLLNENLISKEIRNDKNAYYHINNVPHQHLLKCNNCHKDIWLDFCPMSSISHDIEEKIGFCVTNHTLQINGICKVCIEKQKNI